ncbi:DeoR/GlpR transcriptional regulator [Pigmentiphaga aceris]|uniref:DeoR/GlpR transcriptional regulator n=1 Tax=Pigmentiphaga aceris TaxID=1940612 RepID=A0A5C0AY60_9BURK|nr:DeoR/GlpR family DNA-binding transcription regulator [Pigmentiphaga aceris]QEI07422.1 DeoR/GlpR transcriptional regulator [Pigmentiphaga aceris]
MLQEDRYQRICTLLATVKRLSTERIAADLGVSRETARRDVVALEALGQLRRVRGGVAAKGSEPEPPIHERIRARHAEKHAIARAAVGLLQAGQTLFLDAGSTTLALAEALVSLRGLTIITNGFDIARILVGTDSQAERRHEVIVLGGTLLHGLAATGGALAITEINRYQADVAMLSPVGVDTSLGASSFDHAEAAVARAMAERADRCVILADHSKLGQRSRIAYCPVERIHTLVTDKGARRIAAFDTLRSVIPDTVIA